MSATILLFVGSILQPHILLKYFVQGGKKHSVTGLREVQPGSGGRGSCYDTTDKWGYWCQAGRRLWERPSSCLETFYLLPSAVQIAKGMKRGGTVPEPSDRYSYNARRCEGLLWRGLRMRLRGCLSTFPDLLCGLSSHHTLCCWKMTTICLTKKTTTKQLWCIGMSLVLESEPTFGSLVPGKRHTWRMNPGWMEMRLPGSSVGRWEEQWACCQGDNH